MKLDYKDCIATSGKTGEKPWLKRFGGWIGNWRLHSVLLASAGVSSLLFLLESNDSQASAAALAQVAPDSALSRAELALPEHAPAVDNSINIQPAVQNQWHSATVKSGDTLARIAHRKGINAREIHQLMQTGKTINAITRIRPGESIRYQKNAAGELLALSYNLSETERLRVSKQDGKFNVSIADRPYEIHQNHASGRIENSMYGSAIKAGLSDSLVMEMANIFGYDIDFALDVRKGDSFNLVWDEYYRDGEKIKDGPILAAEFVNNGRTVRAVRFTDAQGRSDYYTPEGKSLRKAFLRSPVHFTRISSKFNPNRLHPIYKTKRPHRGVDYAAKTGTPIYAAGDGKVIFRGKQRGYGNVVIVQHGNKYNTLYAHMSKFNRKVRNGSRVKQGQTIGYVGQTGWATGPHLHYEFRVNGVHRNPLTVKLPTAQPLPKQYRKEFATTSQPLLAQLDILGRTQLALLQAQ